MLADGWCDVDTLASGTLTLPIYWGGSSNGGIHKVNPEGNPGSTLLSGTFTRLLGQESVIQT